MNRPPKIAILNRPVTRKECHWLDRDFAAGEQLYVYRGATYGCVSPTGIACCEHPDQTPFFEIPKDALI